MRGTRALIVGLVGAVVMIGAAPVYAHEFFAKKSGTLKNSGAAKVALTLGSNKVVCEPTLSGKVSEGKEEDQILDLKFGICKGFGTEVTLSEAEYELEASEGEEDDSGSIVINDKKGECTVTLDGISGEGAVGYSGSTTLDTKTKAKEVNYESSGGACGKAEEEDTNGTLEAEGAVELPEGTFMWK
jgi:hypothetical protein